MLWLHYRQAKAEPVDVARAVHSPPVSSIFSFSWTWFVLGAAESEPSSGFVILKSLLKNESFQKRLPHRRRPQVVLGNVVLYLRSSIWPFLFQNFLQNHCCQVRLGFKTNLCFGPSIREFAHRRVVQLKRIY